MCFGIKIIQNKIKTIKLRLCRSEYYTYNMLYADMVDVMPEAAKQLEQIIFSFCGGEVGKNTNAAPLLKIIKSNQEDPRLSELTPETRRYIRKFLVAEIQKESSNSHEHILIIPDSYTLKDIEDRVNGVIENNTLLSPLDYTLVPTFSQSHTEQYFYVSVYYAINSKEHKELSKELITKNCKNIHSSLNELSILLF